MEPHKLIFEETLFLFDWGQDEPRNHCTDLRSIELSVSDILNIVPFTDAIARYHNWFNAFSRKDKAQLLRADVIKFRMEKLSVIQSRFINEMPNHPILRVFTNECKRYDAAQDRILCLPLTAPILKLTKFILVNNFFIKIIKTK